MHYGTIKQSDIANGEGIRTTLFVSGCSHHCKGCFQPETWDFSYGAEFDEAAQQVILESLEPHYVDGLTILGGEPMEPENQAVLAPFLERVHRQFPQKNIWLFTGDVYEDLIDDSYPRRSEDTQRILDVIDVMVDGRYDENLAQRVLRFRGSSNQRIIDMKATRESGEVTFWQDDEIFAKRGEWSESE